MAYNTNLVEQEGYVCVIRLNRPDALNALSQELLGELLAALEKADANEKVRVIVLTGSEKAFAAADHDKDGVIKVHEASRIFKVHLRFSRALPIRMCTARLFRGLLPLGGCLLIRCLLRIDLCFVQPRAGARALFHAVLRQATR